MSIITRNLRDISLEKRVLISNRDLLVRKWDWIRNKYFGKADKRTSKRMEHVSGYRKINLLSIKLDLSREQFNYLLSTRGEGNSVKLEA